MDDVTRPEDLPGRTEGTQPDQVEHPDFRKRRPGGPDTSAARPLEQSPRRERGPRRRSRGRAPGGPAEGETRASRADREAGAPGGHQAAEPPARGGPDERA